MTPLRVSVVLAIAAWLVACSPTGEDRGHASRPAATTPSDQHRRELTALLDRVREEAGAPGAILGVQVGDEPFVAVASGFADRETQRPLGASDPFFLGSFTKTYTAALVLRLAEEGRLSLDDTLGAAALS